MKSLLYVITGFILSISYGQSIGTITKMPCFLEDCSVIKNAPNTEFGYITVPENYSDSTSRNLQIAYVILKTDNPNFKDDPVLIFQGGWGLPMTNQANSYLRMPLLKERDIILFDYRGTGHSTNLPCKNLGKEGWIDLMDNLTIEEFYEKQTQRYSDCIISMQEDGIDYNSYGMNTISRDAAFLAQQLPYSTYNLFGVSYGTMAIQHFIRAADLYDITVRSAVLDSSVPIGVPAQGTMANYYKLSLLNVLKNCESNPNCNAKYPELKNRVISFLKTLNNSPIVLTLNNGKSAYINKEEMNAIIHQLLYDQKIYPTIPLFLERVMARDTEIILKIIPRMQKKVETAYNATGIIEYVYDHKANTALSIENLEKNKSIVKGFEVVDSYLHYYFEDTQIMLDSLANKPIQSNVPALLLSGSYDPITPPEWTQSLQNSFSKNFYFNLDKVGHGAAFNQCGTQILQQFVTNPLKRPESYCVEKLNTTPIPFVTKYHNNSNIITLAKDVLQMENMIILLVVFAIGILLFINVVIGIINFFKKTTNKLRIWRSWTAISGLGILGSVIYLISKTASANSYMLLYGLPNSANWFFIISIIFFVLALMFISKMFKNKAFSYWNLISLFSFIVLATGILIYKLYPSFP